jgi:hypothetical protein
MKKLSKWPWKNISLVVLLIVVAGLFFGGSNPLSVLNQSFLSYDSSEPMMMKSDMAGGSSRGMVREESFASNSLLPPSPGMGVLAAEIEKRELIKTGSLSLIVPDVDESQSLIKEKVDEWNGFVEEANVNNYDDEGQSGWMRLRVPSESFDTAFEALKEMSLKVESERVSVDDVTGQIVDTKARLLSLRAQEKQYLEILTRAKTIEETLQATEYLNRVRDDIEWTDRSLQQVTEEVALSTISVNLIDEGDVKVLGVYWTPWLNVKKATRSALENITESVDVLVGFLLNVPLLLVWLGILYVTLRFGWKGLKKTGLL